MIDEFAKTDWLLAFRATTKSRQIDSSAVNQRKICSASRRRSNKEFGLKAKSTGHAVVKGKSYIMSVCYSGAAGELQAWKPLQHPHTETENRLQLLSSRLA